MPGIPVVISTNGLGVPVKSVTSGGPVMTVATNGLGLPIVFSDRGAPFVVEGGSVVWILGGGTWNDSGNWDDSAIWKDS